jgi:serine/threonine-protein kinase
VTSRRLREKVSAALAERYAIGDELGHGNASVVFAADDLRHGRRVAVKVLFPEVTAVLGRERFLREIAIAAGLAHPHILPLYDSGEADGLLFHVTPLLEGETLRQRLSRERLLPVEDALRIGGELLDAIGYAHRHGIVHRDVKPANIFLSDRHALLGDFGVARALERSGGSRLTATGIVAGTPAYISPEQASGEPLDHRTDLYSAACTIYEMLCGEAPFAARTPQAAIARRLSEEPGSLRLSRPSIPEHVDLCLRRALARLPADRFQSASDMAAALSGSGKAAPSSAPDVPAPATASEGSLSFWQELRRRKVWSVGTIYVSVAWMACSVADLLLGNWGYESALRYLIALSAAGLPIALVLAWAFEVTPEGEVRKTGAYPVADPGARGRSWPLLSTGAKLLLALVLALLAVWLLVFRPLLGS